VIYGDRPSLPEVSRGTLALVHLQRPLLTCSLALVAAACRPNSGGHDVKADTDPEPPRWHVERIEPGLGDATLSGIWGRPDGALVVVGASGFIMTNRVGPNNQDGLWVRMPVATTENLTAITGLSNGYRFGLPPADGEMFAVGWHGTVLHYHPNPDNDATTDDGVWRVVAGPEAGALVPRLRVDPACPDFDGDGIPDDGDGDGWWGNALCHGGQSTGCDDNCREAPNGPERPYVFSGGDTCVGPGASPDPTASQRDLDGDSVGDTCDDDTSVVAPAPRSAAALFAVAAREDNGVLTVMAAGQDGTLVRYFGPSASANPQPSPSIADAGAWITEEGLAFRYSNDCPAGTARGTACSGSGRLPPACPAQCSPLRTTCTCPPNQGQCCDPAAPTGVGCAGGSCPAVPNACDPGTGVCSTLCPDCFRRLSETLRAVAFDGDNVLVAGASGMVLTNRVSTPHAPWLAPVCVPMPSPLDTHPVLAAAGGTGGAFHLAGAAGTLMRFSASGCPYAPIKGAPPAFLSAVRATGASSAYAVGDHGVFLSIGGGAVTQIPTDIDNNLFAISMATSEGHDWYWLGGAGGILLRAAYY
jgi:hypothetical protein